MVPGHPENQDQVLQASEDSQALQLIPEREQRDEGGSWGQEDGVNSASASDQYSTEKNKTKQNTYNYILIVWYFYYDLVKTSGQRDLNIMSRHIFTNQKSHTCELAKKKCLMSHYLEEDVINPDNSSEI